jgi:hypothetical protein
VSVSVIYTFSKYTFSAAKNRLENGKRDLEEAEVEEEE